MFMSTCSFFTAHLANYELYQRQNYPKSDAIFPYQKQLSADEKFRLSICGNF